MCINQHAKYLRKSNKSALGGLANSKGISVKLGMGRSSDHLTNITTGNFKLSWECMQLSPLHFSGRAQCVVCLVECESCFQAWKQSGLPILIPGPLDNSGLGLNSSLPGCGLHHVCKLSALGAAQQATRLTVSLLPVSWIHDGRERGMFSGGDGMPY